MPARGISEKVSAAYALHDGVSVWAAGSLVDARDASVAANNSFTLSVGNVQSAGQLKRIELTATEAVKVPGIVKGRGTLRVGSDESINGTITFNSNKVSGSFEMSDTSGAPITGNFNCAGDL